MAVTYSWAVQRQRNGLWTQQQPLGLPPQDPRGIEDSDEDPYDFVRILAERLKPEGHWSIAVWDTIGVGRLPVATLEGGEQ